MYIAKGKTIQLGNKLIETTNFFPELRVENKLSKKPRKAAEELKKIVEAPNSEFNHYDLSVEQDYSRNVVKLDLLGQCLIGHSDGSIPPNTKHSQYIYQSCELPVTAAVERYKQAAKQLLTDANEGKVQSSNNQVKERRKFWQFWK